MCHQDFSKNKKIAADSKMHVHNVYCAPMPSSKICCTKAITRSFQWAEETEEKEGNYYYFAHFHQLNIFLLLFSWQLIQLNWQKFTSFCDCLISYQKHLFLAKDKTVFVATKGCKRAEWVPQHPAVNEQIWLPVK